MADVLKTLQEEIRSVERSSSNLVKLLAQFERLNSNAVDNAYRMDDVLARISKMSRDYEVAGISSRLTVWAEEAAREVMTLKERFKHEFGRKLQDLLRSRGFELAGRYPDLMVKFYTIHLDFPKGLASLAFGHEPLKNRIPLSPEDITRVLEQADRSLNRPFDPQKFIDLLFEAYGRVCRIRALAAGEKVSLIEMLQQFVFLLQPSKFLADPSKEHFRGYGRVHFGYDLYRLRNSGVRTKENQALGLLTATFDATRKRENFIWVPDNERGDGTTYALIFFKRAETI